MQQNSYASFKLNFKQNLADIKCTDLGTTLTKPQRNFETFGKFCPTAQFVLDSHTQVAHSQNLYKKLFFFCF